MARAEISLGKALAGVEFIVEKLPDGDIMLKRAVVMRVNERSLREPAIKEKLARAVEWMRQNPPQETDLDALESKLVGGVLPETTPKSNST